MSPAGDPRNSLPLFAPEWFGRPLRENPPLPGSNPQADRAVATVDADRPLKARFDGATYSPADDDARLTAQLRRVYDAIKDGQWRTVAEIAAITRDPAPSVSAQLRHLRKSRFGGFNVAKRKRPGTKALFEYRLAGKDEAPAPKEKPSAAAVWRELLELRERVEKLEQERRALSEGGGGR